MTFDSCRAPRRSFLVIGAGLLLAFTSTSRAEGPSQGLETASAAGHSERSKPVQPSSSAGDAALMRAYQREYAFLAAEKSALQRRLTDMESTKSQRRQMAQEELSRQQTRLLELTLQADRLEQSVAAQERDREVQDDAQAAIDAILTQATSLNRAAADVLPEAVADSTTEHPGQTISRELQSAFSAIFKQVQQQSRVRKEPGAFFSEDGRQIKGSILRVGAIAAYGASDDVAGPLAPAGAGSLKIWPGSNKTDTEAIFAGSLVRAPQIFLFESVDRAIEPPTEKSPFDIVRAGGAIAWVIVGLGLLVLALVLLRVFSLVWIGQGMKLSLEETRHALYEQRVHEIRERMRIRRGAMARVLSCALAAHGLTREARQDRIDEQILGMFQLIDRFGNLVLVAAAVAPLLGLLGTVTGMISTFDAITEFGTGDPKVLAGGISEALITTELGLIVAIPTLLVGNLLAGIADRMKKSLEVAALTVCNLIDEGEAAQHIDHALKRVA